MFWAGYSRLARGTVTSGKPNHRQFLRSGTVRSLKLVAESFETIEESTMADTLGRKTLRLDILVASRS
jgi:hypothetical protein